MILKFATKVWLDHIVQIPAMHVSNLKTRILWRCSSLCLEVVVTIPVMLFVHIAGLQKEKYALEFGKAMIFMQGIIWRMMIKHNLILWKRVALLVLKPCLKYLHRTRHNLFVYVVLRQENK